MRALVAAVAAAAFAAALVLAACGDDEGTSSTPRASQPVAGALELLVRADKGPGAAAVSMLHCRPGDMRATGPLAKRADISRLCTSARLLTGLLTSKPPARRVCTQVYGGPQTLRFTGTIGERSVDRMFTRTNGCAIKEYEQITQALPL